MLFRSLNAQFELGAPCSCGMWNSIVDLVAGISDFGAGISQNPTDLVKGINNFISALGQSDTWEAMGDALKKHHGVYNTSVKTPQAVYGACYDAIFVASFFVGAGEIKALSEASSFADVMRVVGKVSSNGKAPNSIAILRPNTGPPSSRATTSASCRPDRDRKSVV